MNKIEILSYRFPEFGILIERIILKFGQGDMKIELLVNQSKYIEDVAEMINKEFVINKKSNKTFKEVRKFFSNTYENKFPLTLIALEKGECIGTVSIFEYDLIERKIHKPWLASLYTDPKHRGKGVGQQLITETIKVIKNLGYQNLYLRTEGASSYYLLRGWKLLESVQDETGEKLIYLLWKNFN